MSQCSTARFRWRRPEPKGGRTLASAEGSRSGLPESGPPGTRFGQSRPSPVAQSPVSTIHRRRGARIDSGSDSSTMRKLSSWRFSDCSHIERTGSSFSFATSRVQNQGSWPSGPANARFSRTRYPASSAAAHSERKGASPLPVRCSITIPPSGGASEKRFSRDHWTGSKRLRSGFQRTLFPRGVRPCAESTKTRSSVGPVRGSGRCGSRARSHPSSGTGTRVRPTGSRSQRAGVLRRPWQAAGRCRSQVKRGPIASPPKAACPRRA